MKQKWAYAAVVTAALSVTSTLVAQTRVGNDGHALDANNRMGSGGYNSQSDVPAGLATGNDIVTGNVGGNRQFRGQIPYGSSNEFRGSVGTDASDRFLRASAGVDYRQQSNGQAPPVFYGNRLNTAPPAGVQPDFGTGTYISAPPPPRLGSDLRLGVPALGATVVLPRPGELVLPGPVDPSTNQALLVTASPLYGIRQWNPNDQTDQIFLSKYTSLTLGTGPNQSKLTPDQVTKARDELANNALDSEAIGGTDATTTTNLNTPALGSKTIDSTANPANPTASADQPTLRQRILVPPEKQSAQLAELKKRRSKLEVQGQLNDAEAARLYAAELRLRNEQKADNGEKLPDRAKPEKPLVVTPSTSPTRPEEAPRPEPMKIASLADGIKAKGLHDLLVEAESRVKEGKFSVALDAYDSAEQIAPNNPLILLGRAHAELGASYYGKAESDLRLAVQAEPALLLAQYDLRTLFGDQRLQFLVKDLREIAQSEQKQVRPLLLLAYISYNTDNVARAAVYLDQAAQRGGDDAVLNLMRATWTLPK